MASSPLATERAASGQPAELFALPAALLSQGFRLRPETEADTAFLMRLYASTREEELQQTPWSDEEKQAFLASQFQAQRHHYRTYIPNCRFEILERAGTAMGRLYLETRKTQMHVVDIALMPQSRGQGIGTGIIVALQEAAAGQAKGVGIFVEKFNPALRLYRRLGFEEIADQGVYLEMEWLPKPA